MRLLRNANIDTTLSMNAIDLNFPIQRLTAIRERNRKTLRIETMEQTQNRLESMRETQGRNRSIGKDNLLSVINISACSICRELLSPDQRCLLETLYRQDLLPNELVGISKIETCFLCYTNLNKGKVHQFYSRAVFNYSNY